MILESCLKWKSCLDPSLDSSRLYSVVTETGFVKVFRSPQTVYPSLEYPKPISKIEFERIRTRYDVTFSDLNFRQFTADLLKKFNAVFTKMVFGQFWTIRCFGNTLGVLPDYLKHVGDSRNIIIRTCSGVYLAPGWRSGCMKWIRFTIS